MTLFEPIFAALERAGVRYVTVGGVAVVLHGHARLTADLDLVVDLAPRAVSEAIDALTALGFRPRLPVEASGFLDPAVREWWITQQGMTVFSMWDPDDPLRSVDLFVDQPVDVEELWERSTPAQRLRWVEEAIEFAWLAGALPRDPDPLGVVRAHS